MAGPRGVADRRASGDAAGRSDLAATIQSLYAPLRRRFVLGWKTLGHERRLRAFIVNYADDFVICCRGSAEKAAAVGRGTARYPDEYLYGVLGLVRLAQRTHNLPWAKA